MVVCAFNSSAPDTEAEEALLVFIMSSRPAIWSSDVGLRSLGPEPSHVPVSPGSLRLLAPWERITLIIRVFRDEIRGGLGDGSVSQVLAIQA